MKRGEPAFAIKVDVTNPGQFFACCGLLEVANILWPGAEGWFEGANFCVSSTDREASLSILMRRLLKADARPGEIHGTITDFKGKAVDPKKVCPIEIGTPIKLRLAWWLDEIRSKFSPLKLWSGRQSSWDVFCNLREAGDGHEGFDGSILEVQFPLKSRFGVDPRSAWETLGAGFSPNTLGMAVATFWATELLASVALAFSPPALKDEQFCYATWLRPLPAVVARAAVTGVLPIEGRRRFAFKLVTRGSFDGFRIATPIGD
jgi:CRISPR-associated protein Csx14